MSNYQSYTIGQDDPQPENIRDDSGATGVRVNIRDTVTMVSSTNGVNTETTQGHQKGSTAELNPYHGTDSIFATARQPNGRAAEVILPTTLVEIDGVQAPVSFWVTEGRLQKDGDGYKEASGNPEAAPVDTAEVMPMHDQAMASVNEALAEVDQGSLDGLAAVAVGIAAGRVDPGMLAQRFGQVSGLTPDESQARVATITAAYQAQADAALHYRCGIAGEDLPEFYRWAKANRQGQLQEAVHKQLHQHDVSGYRGLAEQWVASTGPSLQALKAAGYPVRPDGQVYVKGSWMTPAGAARAGLV